ncbi:MAG: hypothetical protein Q9178_002749 [Gyalolechia marmorata]
MDTTKRPAKRRFQTDITSYFSIHEPNTPTHAEKASTSSPRIPSAIQSSLLNVGMRVRKAVPEGYKTKSFDEDMPQTMRDGRARASNCSGYTELVPYCGMVKIGGYDGMPLTPDIDVSPGMLFEDDAFESVPSSQESVLEPENIAVHQGLRSMAAKRSFIDDEGDGEEFGLERAGQSASPGTVEMSGSISLRPIAQARNRRRATTKFKSACDGDFGEAPFLRDLNEDMDFGD